MSTFLTAEIKGHLVYTCNTYYEIVLGIHENLNILGLRQIVYQYILVESWPLL